MKLRLLTGDDVRQCLSMPRAIDLMADAFAALSSGQVSVPLRTKIASANGTMLYKPALLQSAGIFVVKTVSVFPGNVAKKLPVTTGLLLVNDAATGLPIAMMDAEYLTALRTGAASGLACRWLANPGVTRAALIGTGGQAECQLTALLCSLPQLEEVYIFSRHSENAEAFCRRQAEVVRTMSSKCRLIANADRTVLATCGAICTTTTSRIPVITDNEVGPGTHINGIGSFTPAMAEVPATTVCRAAVFVDQRAACLSEAGDLVQPISQGLLSTDFYPPELGEVVLGTAPGRTSDDQVTLFKSVGNAAQDLVSAAEVLRHAEAHGIGSTIEV